MDFRQYDPAMARFYAIDLLAESSYSVTPYHFAENNPISGSDPTGLKTYFNGEEHKVTDYINNHKVTGIFN